MTGDRVLADEDLCCTRGISIRVWPVDPAEVHGAALGRILPWALRELLDVVGRHPQAEDVAVEAERDLHVAYSDGDVRDRLDAHGSDVIVARRAPQSARRV